MPLFKNGFLDAVQKGDHTAVEGYLCLNAEVSQQTTDPFSYKRAIHIAAENFDRDMVTLLCTYPGHDINDFKRGKPNALTLVALSDRPVAERVDMMLHLIKCGAVANHQDVDGNTLLNHIIEKKKWDILPSLVGLGMDLKICPQLVLRMLEKKASDNDILFCIDHGADTTAYFRPSGCPVQKQPWHLACAHGRAAIINKLIENKQNMTARVLYWNNHPSDECGISESFADKTGGTLAYLLRRGGSFARAQDHWQACVSNRGTAWVNNNLGDIKRVIETELNKQKTTPAVVPVATLPTPAPIAAPQASAWQKISEECVAQTVEFPALDRRVTHIFNFAALERQTVTENLRTQAESSETRRFAEIEDTVLATALDAFEKEGGTADRMKILRQKPAVIGKIVEGAHL